MQEKENFISPLVAISIIAVSFVLYIFFGAAIILVFGDWSLILAMIIGEVLLLIFPLGYMLLRGVDVRKYVGLEIKVKHVLLGVALGAFLFLVNWAVSAILISTLGVSEIVEETNTLMINMSSSIEGTLSLIYNAKANQGDDYAGKHDHA